MTEQEQRNKEFGIAIAELMWQEGMTKCPWILNSEQADALYERWNELKKENKNKNKKSVTHH